MKNGDKAKLILPNTEIELDILEDEKGAKAIDITQLHASAGMFTFDVGLSNTVSCESSISYVNGVKGELSYRGRKIEELAEYTYLEVAFLCAYGHLPTQEELAKFEKDIYAHSKLDKELEVIANNLNGDHPMACIGSLMMAYSSYKASEQDLYNEEYRSKVIFQTLGIMPQIAGMACQKALTGSAELIPMDESMDYTENFLYMAFKDKKKAQDPLIKKTMDKMLIIHADHGQNASTSVVRFTGSSLSNPFAAMSAGISSLWGPSHGGATMAAMNMFDSIMHDSLSAEDCLAKAKDKNDPFRLMGFGHRVYKAYDPRANIAREYCKEIIKQMSDNKSLEPYFQLALELESAALADSYFQERNLYPNMDFYVGIILKAVGFKTNLFTVIFALGRSIGWMSQWKEMYDRSSGALKIVRPRQLSK